MGVRVDRRRGPRHRHHLARSRWSLDEAFDLHASSWTGFLVALLVGVGGAGPARRVLPSPAKA
ncbi:MAG: hypothetical protein R2705_20455 [Ilumatobacteraceae bacterium]